MTLLICFKPISEKHIPNAAFTYITIRREKRNYKDFVGLTSIIIN